MGEPFTEEPYGIGIAKDDVEFCEFINDALAENEDAYITAREETAGEVEGTETPSSPSRPLCLTRAHPPAAVPLRAPPRPRSPERAPVDAVTDNLDLYWSGFLRSLGICMWGMVGSLALGNSHRRVPSLTRSSTPRFRNCVGDHDPQLPADRGAVLHPRSGSPRSGSTADYYTFGVSALILYTSAFVCEALRSGINSVSAGQAEAARAIGLTFTPASGLRSCFPRPSAARGCPRWGA